MMKLIVLLVVIGVLCVESRKMDVSDCTGSNTYHPACLNQTCKNRRAQIQGACLQFCQTNPDACNSSADCTGANTYSQGCLNQTCKSPRAKIQKACIEFCQANPDACKA